MVEFKLHYHCSNGGDGSVSVDFHESADKAKQADENMDEGWGESSASDVSLKLVGDTLYFREYEEVNGKYDWVWKIVEKVAE